MKTVKPFGRGLADGLLRVSLCDRNPEVAGAMADEFHDLKGVEMSEVRKPIEAGRDLVIRTDVQGARTWREKLEGGIFIFFPSCLRTRTFGRPEASEKSGLLMVYRERRQSRHPRRDRRRHPALHRAVYGPVVAPEQPGPLVPRGVPRQQAA